MVVTKLDRLARSLPGPRAMADVLTTRQVSLSLGGSVYDPTDAVGKLLFNVLAVVREFESDLIRPSHGRGREGREGPRRLLGKQPKLNPRQKRTWCRSCAAASTAPSRQLSCSAWPLHRLPRHRAPSSANASRPAPISLTPLRDANRRLGGVPQPTPDGTPTCGKWPEPVSNRAWSWERFLVRAPVGIPPTARAGLPATVRTTRGEPERL